MDVPTSIASGVKSVSNDYDAACKRLLSEKQVLSRMMGEWLDEFSGMEPRRIEHDCFVGDPRIGMDPVGRDEVAAGRVPALVQEDSTQSEGTVIFDVRFEALVPDVANPEEDIICVEVDVEAQNDFHPGYPLLRRGVFYGSRLLSQQGDEVIPGSHYERVRKVVSIWVCAHPPRKYAGTVTRFALEPRSLLGDAAFEPQDYGLIEVLMVCLDDENPGSSQGALGMLEVLLSGSLSAPKKLDYLESQCGIVISKSLDEKVVGMCNLSVGLLEDGYKAGHKAGHKAGRKEGREEGREEEHEKFLKAIAAMVSDGSLAFADAVSRFGFSEQELRAALS